MSKSEIEQSTGEHKERKRRKRDTGRILMPRDQMISTSLYLGPGATTEQLAMMYFPSQAYLNNPNTDQPRYSENSAKVRLYALRDEGLVHTDRYTPLGEAEPVRYWYLTKKQYRKEAKGEGRRNESYMELPRRLSHHFKTTEIYARIRPRFEEIFARLDPYEYPEWQWENEAHAFRQYQFEGKDKKHQPDAEIHMPDGQVFFIERQTEDSRKSASVFNDKVEKARTYTRYQGYPKGTAKLLFACDSERDRGYAKDALQGGGIKGVIGDTDTIVRYLITRAEEVVENTGEAA